jgi:hypothetical protein
MTGLLGRVKRLERGAGDECPVCGWPEPIQLKIVEVLVVTSEQAREAMAQKSNGEFSAPESAGDWLKTCEECGRRPYIAEIVEVEVVDPDGTRVIGGGIPQRR